MNMAALARLSRKAFISHRQILRPLSTAAAAASAQHQASAQSPPPPPGKITEWPDRVKWDYGGQRQNILLGEWKPKIAVDAYVAPNVVLAGQVTVWDGASVWNGSVLRGDLNKITGYQLRHLSRGL